MKSKKNIFLKTKNFCDFQKIITEGTLSYPILLYIYSARILFNNNYLTYSLPFFFYCLLIINQTFTSFFFSFFNISYYKI